MLEVLEKPESALQPEVRAESAQQSGTVAVVGLGYVGLPLAVGFAIDRIGTAAVEIRHHDAINGRVEDGYVRPVVTEAAHFAISAFALRDILFRGAHGRPGLNDASPSAHP